MSLEIDMKGRLIQGEENIEWHERIPDFFYEIGDGISQEYIIQGGSIISLIYPPSFLDE